jgi:hypothetical protein
LLLLLHPLQALLLLQPAALLQLVVVVVAAAPAACALCCCSCGTRMLQQHVAVCGMPSIDLVAHHQTHMIKIIAAAAVLAC